LNLRWPVPKPFLTSIPVEIALGTKDVLDKIDVRNKKCFAQLIEKNEQLFDNIRMVIQQD